MGKKKKRNYITADEMFGKGWNTPSGMAQTNADLRYYRARDARNDTKQYIKNPKDFYTAWFFLESHPANINPMYPTDSMWVDNYNVMVVKVDPKTNRIEDRTTKKGYQRPDKKRNTATRVWIEWGPHLGPAEASSGWGDPNSMPQGIGSHDYRVDTGGKTFEEAVINLAHNIFMLYGAEATVKNNAKLKKKDRW